MSLCEDKGKKSRMSLCEDVVFPILLLLRVRSLLRFKCVCKEWCALIKSRVFKDTYLALRRASTANGIVSLMCADDMISFISWYNDYQTLVTPIYFDIPFKPGNDCSMVNHVDGIVCFYIGNNWFDIILVNPAMKEYRKLPKFDLAGFRCRQQGIGFGYDVATDEYKVVAVVTLNEKENDYDSLKHICLVYRLSTDSWTILGDMSAFVSKCYVSSPIFMKATLHMTNCEVIFSHGSIHWTIFENLYEPNYKILAFNLTNETFREIKFPHGWTYYPFHNGDVMFPHLFIVDNSTFALVASRDDGGSKCHPNNDDDDIFGLEPIMEIWVMKDYDDSDSWTKQYSIGSSHLFSRVISFWNKDYLFVDEDLYFTCFDLCKYQVCGDKLHHICMAESESEALGIFLTTGHESLVSVKQVYKDK